MSASYTFSHTPIARIQIVVKLYRFMTGFQHRIRTRGWATALVMLMVRWMLPFYFRAPFYTSLAVEEQS